MRLVTTVTLAATSLALAAPALASPAATPAATAAPATGRVVAAATTGDPAPSTDPSTEANASFDLSDVVLASGEQAHLADSVASGPFATLMLANTVLTTGASLSPAAHDYLASTKPQVVYVVGGLATVTPAVVTALRAELPGVKVYRLAGADRYATATAVARLADRASQYFDSESSQSVRTSSRR